APTPSMMAHGSTLTMNLWFSRCASPRSGRLLTGRLLTNGGGLFVAPYAARLCVLRTSQNLQSRGVTRCDVLRGFRHRALLVVSVEFLGFLSRKQPDLDKVERADEAVADAKTARPHDRVAKRNRPMVFQQDERGGRVVWDLLYDIPGVLVRECVDAFRCRLGA